MAKSHNPARIAAIRDSEKALAVAVIDLAVRHLRAPTCTLHGGSSEWRDHEGDRNFYSAFVFLFRSRLFEEWCEWLDLDTDAIRQGVAKRIPRVQQALEFCAAAGPQFESAEVSA